MIRKLLEAFFGHKLLLLLPPILIPGLVTPIALLSTPVTYDTSVSIWVDHPTYLTVREQGANWNTPALTESGRLTELLRTRAFTDYVAQRTSLAPLVGTTSGEVIIGEVMSKGVSIGAATAGSDHLLVIRVSVPTAQLSYELAKAVVEGYQEKIAADQADQAGLAVQFYQGQVKDTQLKQAKATNDLKRYVAGQQAITADQQADTSPNQLPATMLDSKLAALQAGVQAAQAEAAAAQSALRQAQQDSMAWTEGQQLGFQVLDPPTMPTQATRQTKKVIIYPIAAAVAALGLSGLLLVLLVAGDRSTRDSADLAPGLRLLGTVPMLKVKRVPKQLRGVATRRAIGAVAGTALPAPGGAR